MHYPVAVEEVHPREDLPHDVLDPVLGEAGRGALLYVEVEVLVNVLEHQEQVHLPAELHALAVADVQQSAAAQTLQGDHHNPGKQSFSAAVPL